MSTYQNSSLVLQRFISRSALQMPKQNRLIRWLSPSLCMATLLTSNQILAIANGTPSAVPWVVQLIGLDNHKPRFLCVGAAISDQAIITEEHCEPHAVSYADRTVNIASSHVIQGSRIRLLFLTAPHALTQYAKLGPNYLATNTAIAAGTLGTVYGYGSGYFLPQQSATLRAHFHAQSTKVPEAIYMAPIGQGVVEPGDSGGPLVINGAVVGVLKGPAAAPVGNFVYTGLSPALDGIAQLIYQRKAARFMASEL